MNRLIAVATIILAVISHIYAEEFTVFDINDRGIWHGDVTGYSSIVTKGGRRFILSTSNEGGGIPLTSPQYASSAWRVPDETSFTIVSEEMEMKSILVVFDDYNGGMYIVPAMTEGGWTGILNKAACKYELTSAGELRMKALAAYGEMRIISVIVSDEIPYVPGEDPSWKEDDLICENSFAESLAGWSVENETGFSTGWKVNRVDGMAEAGADAETAEVRTLLYKSFDLNCRRGTKLLFEQAFFGEYPEVQPGWAQLVTRPGGGAALPGMKWTCLDLMAKKLRSVSASSAFPVKRRDGESVTSECTDRMFPEWKSLKKTKVRLNISTCWGARSLNRHTEYL